MRLRSALKTLLRLPGATLARLRAHSARAPRFTGAYASRSEALDVIPATRRAGYDDETIADVSFVQMCERPAWDYPLIFWLDRILHDGASVLDVGGHMGTKYIAFSEVLDLSGVTWTVHDLPGIVNAAYKAQAAGRLPPAIRFTSHRDALPQADILLVSGVLQYLDIPFSQLLADLPDKPRHILLNKVALRDGPTLFTVERIGHGRVPYRIRNRAEWQAELDTLGYLERDSWTIPDLGHVIPTHPWLGQSESRGYCLERAGD